MYRFIYRLKRYKLASVHASVHLRICTFKDYNPIICTWKQRTHITYKTYRSSGPGGANISGLQLRPAILVTGPQFFVRMSICVGYLETMNGRWPSDTSHWIQVCDQSEIFYDVIEETGQWGRCKVFLSSLFRESIKVWKFLFEIISKIQFSLFQLFRVRLRWVFRFGEIIRGVETNWLLMKWITLSAQIRE